MSRRWALTVSIVVIGTAFLLHYLAIGLPGVGYRDGLRFPVGWNGMARQVERIERRLRESGSAEPIVVGMNRYTDEAPALTLFAWRELSYGHLSEPTFRPFRLGRPHVSFFYVFRRSLTVGAGACVSPDG